MPNILGNKLYRELDRWFAEYDGTWQKYCSQIDLLDDRPGVIALVSAMEDAREGGVTGVRVCLASPQEGPP
jgi:hypothetical protein